MSEVPDFVLFSLFSEERSKLLALPCAVLLCFWRESLIAFFMKFFLCGFWLGIERNLL